MRGKAPATSDGGKSGRQVSLPPRWERAGYMPKVQRGIGRRARKDADFQAFALLRLSHVREQTGGDLRIGAATALPPGAGLYYA